MGALYAPMAFHLFITDTSNMESNNETTTSFQSKEKIYEGKAKQIYTTDDPDLVIIRYKDDASAYNGIKRAQIENKGILNNKISSIIYKKLEENGIKTHFVQRLNDREQLCRRKNVIPLEFIARNIAAGSMARRLGLDEGHVLSVPIYEICYKNDRLGDPVINETHAVALGLSSFLELNEAMEMLKLINHILIVMFKELGITLVDFKVEFGRLDDGSLILADELSPDTCRLWDTETLERLDKDRFRRDLGRVGEAYQEILKRLS